MRILDIYQVPSALWGEYKATRQHTTSYGPFDVFLGDEPQHLVLIRVTGRADDQLVLIEIDPAQFESIYRLDADEYLDQLPALLKAKGLL